MTRAWLVTISLLVMCSITANAALCSPQDVVERVRVVDVVDVTHLSTSGMNLYLEVENDTWHRLTLSEASIDVIIDGESVATLSLRDKLVIRRKTTTILVPLRFKARSAFIWRHLQHKIFGGDDSDITLHIALRGGIGPFRRSYTVDSITPSQLLDRLGVDDPLKELFSEKRTN